MKNYIGEIVLSILTLGFGFLMGRKKEKASLRKTEAEAEKLNADANHIKLSSLNEAVKIYKQIHDDTIKQMDKLMGECAKLRQECAELKSEVHNLRLENNILKTKLSELDRKMTKGNA